MISLYFQTCTVLISTSALLTFLGAPDHADGVAIRQEEDPAADATSEPAGSDEGDARTRPGTTADGTAGEEGDRRHQEDG